MGAAPLFVGFGQVHNQLESGLLDAAVTGADPGYGQRWYEVSRYINGPLHSFIISSNVISRGVWDSLPQDLQRIFLEEGAKAELEALRLASIQNEVGIQKNLEAGIELVTFSDEIRERSFNVAVMEHVLPGWINRLSGGASNEFVQVFNDKVGPLVGLRITGAGTVEKTP